MNAPGRSVNKWACGKARVCVCLHANVSQPMWKRLAGGSKCECARVYIWGTKCVIKQRREYVIRYVINPHWRKKNNVYIYIPYMYIYIYKTIIWDGCCLGIIGNLCAIVSTQLFFFWTRLVVFYFPPSVVILSLLRSCRCWKCQSGWCESSASRWILRVFYENVCLIIFSCYLNLLSVI